MSKTTKLVIVGGGFAGLELAKSLHTSGMEVTLIDRTNHHLFQALLYQVATAGLSPEDIAAPLRAVLRKKKNIRVIMDEVIDIDTERKEVVTTKERYPFDKLVLASGARHSYFGNDHWEEHAIGLKTLDDALALRKKILSGFEIAEQLPPDSEQRSALLTFVVVGAGPTGVEMAGAIAELARFTLRNEFRKVDPAKARVVLVEAGPRVLPTFHPSLSLKAMKHLQDLGVEVHLNAPVSHVAEDHVVAGGKRLPTGTVVWAAGNKASPLGGMLKAELDSMGRVVVNEDLTVVGQPDVYVIGDLAHFKGKDGKPLPGVSPVAIQQGKLVALNLRRAQQGRSPLPFRYFDKGSMATIGRHAAVADLRGLRFGGFFAWLGWLFVHLIFLVGFRNRVAVLMHWAYAYFTRRKAGRLIHAGIRIKEPPKAPEPAPIAS
ncbi:MAG: NAD(P)/FAD-dependent oxidoreductase [Verrucomicrobiia bacterium]